MLRHDVRRVSAAVDRLDRDVRESRERFQEEAVRFDVLLMYVIVGAQCAVVIGVATWGLFTMTSWGEQTAMAAVLLIATQVLAALEGSTNRTTSKVFQGRLL